MPAPDKIPINFNFFRSLGGLNILISLSLCLATFYGPGKRSSLNLSSDL